jgi:hypothetical protein
MGYTQAEREAIIRRAREALAHDVRAEFKAINAERAKRHAGQLLRRRMDGDGLVRKVVTDASMGRWFSHNTHRVRVEHRYAGDFNKIWDVLDKVKLKDRSHG